MIQANYELKLTFLECGSCGSIIGREVPLERLTDYENKVCLRCEEENLIDPRLKQIARIVTGKNGES